tara:strand:- start:101 stop:475 length:375 start_codon:yes stop_codon:yes gene_type:complete
MPEERSIYVEVEENDNCEYMPMLVYEGHRQPVQVSKIIIDDPGRPEGICDVTGWSSEGGGTPCIAFYVPVSDSGQAIAHLVYGGDWGIRMKPENVTEPWDVSSSLQWGEPYLVLLDKNSIIEAD